MKYLMFLGALVIAIVVTLAWTDSRLTKYDRASKARESLLQDSLAKTILRVGADSVEVVRTVTQVRTLRDSVMVNKTDTMLVERMVYATDTLRIACGRCAESAGRLKVWSDSSIQFWKGRYELVRPSWRDRLGVTVGYGITKDGTNVKVGPQVGVSVRVLP